MLLLKVMLHACDLMDFDVNQYKGEDIPLQGTITSCNQNQGLFAHQQNSTREPAGRSCCGQKDQQDILHLSKHSAQGCNRPVPYTNQGTRRAQAYFCLCKQWSNHRIIQLPDCLRWPISLGRITLGKTGCLLIPLSTVSHHSIHPQVGILQSSTLKTISPRQ